MSVANTNPDPSPAEPVTPIAGFSRCHAGILAQLDASAELPALAEAAERARRVATDTLAMFEPGVLEHHTDEEGDLFPAVLRDAVKGTERERVGAMVQQLTHEHRLIESLWKRVKPALKLIAHGKPADLDTAAMNELVTMYADHARYEEQEFLPLAQEILGRNDLHLAALGVSLHVRHVHLPVGYI